MDRKTLKTVANVYNNSHDSNVRNFLPKTGGNGYVYSILVYVICKQISLP